MIGAGAQQLTWLYLPVAKLHASAGALYACNFAGGFTQESLLVVRELSVQASLTTPTPSIGRRSWRFIPTSLIGDPRIHDGFCDFEGIVLVFTVSSFSFNDFFGGTGVVFTGWGVIDTVTEAEGAGVGVEGDEVFLV